MNSIENSKKTLNKQTIKLYWEHMRTRKLHIVAQMATSAIGMLSDQFIAPLLVASAFDTLSRTGGNVDFLDTFGPMLVIYALLLLATNIFWRINIWLIWGFETQIKKELAARCFDFLTHQSQRFHNNRFGGALVSQTNKFVFAFERLYDEFQWTIWTNIVAYVATIVILLPKAPTYVAVLLVISSLYIWAMIVRNRKIQPYNIRESESETALTAQLADSIANINTVTAFANEDTEAKLFATKTQDLYQSSLDNRRVNTINDTIFSLLNHTQAWLALFFGLYAVTNRGAAVGTFYLITSYTFNLLNRLWQFNRLMRNLNRGFGDAHNMTEMLQLAQEITDVSGAKILHARRGDIRFKGVRFAYPERPDKPLFDKLTLHIKPGEKIGLVGPSGGGKTSLTKLLLRFSDIDKGTIMIDGQNIANVTQRSLRNSIAYVPQEPLMFHRTIAENIRYGQLDADEQAIIGVAKLANAHEFIESLPQKYDTLVGERGLKLSGGQRQRIAIARAMLKNAPILVLDEATSALDSESEVLIQDALWKLMQNRTAIVIAHRLSTIQKMDRIIVLDKGQIAEEGSHKELLAKGGIYAQLWGHQSGGFIEE